MASKLVTWFASMSLPKQIIALALVFDPLGFAAGWLLAPSVGLEPLFGAAIGVVVAGVPVSLRVLLESVTRA
jgi:hypothetical protein